MEDRTCQSKLCDFIQSGELENAVKLLKDGVSPNAGTGSDVSAMHLAAGLGLETLCLLLQHDGDPNSRLADGTTPVHVAAIWGKHDCVQILLANGGDPFLRDQDGLSALDLAIRYQHEEVIHILDYYSQLLCSSVDQTTTPLYTYRRLSGGSVISDRDRDSPTSSDASYNTALDRTFESVSERTLNRSLCGTELCDTGPGCVRQGRRSSMYLRSVQSQLDRCFKDGQKTHVVDVTSPDHPYVEPKRPGAVGVTSDTGGRMAQLTATPKNNTISHQKDNKLFHRHSTRASLETPQTIIKCEGINSHSRGDKYCNRTALFSPLEDLLQNNNMCCEFCGTADMKLGDGNICATCDQLNHELEKLAVEQKTSNKKYFDPVISDLVYDAERNTDRYRHDDNVQSGVNKNDTEEGIACRISREKKHFIQKSVSVKDRCELDCGSRKMAESMKHAEEQESDSNSLAEFMRGLDYPTLDTDLSLNENNKNKFKVCKDTKKHFCEKTHIGRNSNSCKEHNPVLNDSLISDDKSFEGLQEGQDMCNPNHLDEAYLHPDYLSDITVSDGDNDTNSEMNDLWTQVRNSNQKQRKLRAARKVLDNAFIGRESCNTIYSDASTVEYVYTDMENNIMLIEKHIPSQCSSVGSRRSLDNTISDHSQKSENGCGRRTSPQGQGHLMQPELSINTENTVLYDWKEIVADLVPGINDVDNAGDLFKTDAQNMDSAGDRVKTDAQHIDNAGDRIKTDAQHINNDELRSKLIGMGDAPGPVTKTTRQTYLARLSQIERDGKVLTKQAPGYPSELRLALDGNLDLSDMAKLEVNMVSAFQKPNQARRWREGTMKSSFNYILLDPRITCDLPNRAVNMDDKCVFQTFISAIFYVGKGKRSRPYSHLYEAIKQKKKASGKTSHKVQTILDIWKSGLGVVSLHCFQSVIPVEAYTREACMVDAIGLQNLTNMKRGDYYGVSTTYSMKLRRKIGVYLLSKALLIFLADGERQISPPDIKCDS